MSWKNLLIINWIALIIFALSILSARSQEIGPCGKYGEMADPYSYEEITIYVEDEESESAIIIYLDKNGQGMVHLTSKGVECHMINIEKTIKVDIGERS